MEIYLVEEIWQLALVYDVRMNYHLRGKENEVKLKNEFNEEYGKEYIYTLLADGEFGLATCRINPISTDTCKIERVATREGYQGKGLGSKLLKFTEQKIKKMGYKNILIHSYFEAKNFYLNNGYKIDESIIIESDVPQVALRKKLAD